MPKPARSRYLCQSCGHVEARWLGRCPACNEWSSLVEEVAPSAGGAGPARPAGALTSGGTPQRLSQVPAQTTPRLASGMPELDRVLGGGLVPGSLVLLGGDPGIGKSTLLLQALDRLAHAARVLYVSGEESARQIALRAERLGAKSAQLLVLAETNLERILAQAESLRPQVLAVD